jgi:GDPmannose 4,6-dehydratase
MKKAFITGITGQDGAYLSHFLLEKGYEVHGLRRRSSSMNTDRMDYLSAVLKSRRERFFLHYGDVCDAGNMIRLLKSIQPDEIYHLASMSHVQISFEQPANTAEINGLGTLHLLDAIKILDFGGRTRFYQASTSELYGNATQSPQTELTPFSPASPYAISKLFAYWTTLHYRKTYQIFACNGILFNHESPLRSEHFVTRKITGSVARIALGLQKTLVLGNLNARRDWGHARDYVQAMWLMLQKDRADDYVIAGGTSTSVRQFVQKSFHVIGVTLYFKGKGLEEKGYCSHAENPLYPIKPKTLLVSVDACFFRPSEVEHLVGDSSKAALLLPWKPTISLDCLIREMVEADLDLIEKSQKMVN